MTVPGPSSRQTFIAASTTVGVVMPLYVLASYYTIGLQQAIRGVGGIRQFLAAHPLWTAVYDVAEATVLAAFSVLVAFAIFLSMSKRWGSRRLFRGWIAALPVLVIGSALGRYLHDPSAPMPGLLAVILTILVGVGIAMRVA